MNLLSYPNATLVAQVRQVGACSENLNYVTLAPQARPSGEILNYSLSRYSDILYMIIAIQSSLTASLFLNILSLEQYYNIFRSDTKTDDAGITLRILSVALP